MTAPERHEPVHDVALAGLGSRALARVVDALVPGLLFLFFLFLSAFGGTTAGDVRAAYAVWAFATVCVYPFVCEAIWGRTLGKAVVGLRVLTVEGANISARAAAARAVLGLVDIVASSGFAGVIAILSSPTEQRLGDRVADTIVVRDRRRPAAAAPAPPLPPAGHHQFLSALDPAALSDEEVAIAHEILTRESVLQRNRFEDLAYRYAAFVDTRLGLVRPPDMLPQAFLAAVVSAHHGVVGPDATPRPDHPSPPPPPPGSVGSPAPAPPAAPPPAAPASAEPPPPGSLPPPQPGSVGAPLPPPTAPASPLAPPPPPPLPPAAPASPLAPPPSPLKPPEPPDPPPPA